MIRSQRRLSIGRTETGSARFVETADFSGLAGPGSQGMGLPANTSTTSLATPQIDLPMLDGFMNPDKASENRMFREMFERDPVAGAAVDMMSTLPFSDFSLVGMNDERRLQKFAMSVERMKIRNQLPVISTDYIVFGKHISVMNWNEKDKIYDALLPQNIDCCEIQTVPIAGADPLIKLIFPPEIMNALKSKDARMKQALDRIPEHIRNKMSKGGVDLNPDDLLFIARQGTSGHFNGFSAFNRLLPIWLIEKALYRGTLDQSWKRQRGILHITMGDPDWTPQPADYAFITKLFGDADADPTGATVATRDSINVNEIRRGDDFWKITDIADWATKMKLMALGISESFVTGEGNINAMDNNLSVILQYFSHYRDNITREVFYDKNFPTIARENGYFRRQNIAISSYERYSDGTLGLGLGDERVETANGFVRELDGTFSAEFGAKNSNEGSYYDRTKYEMPKVHWHNSLKSDSSQDYLEMLTTLESKGVPIPIRSWAAAGGLTVRELIESQSSDKRIREQFLPWVQEIRKYNAAADPNMEKLDGDGGGGFEGASVEGPRPYSPNLGGTWTPWYLKDYGDALSAYGINHRGNRVPLTARREREVNEKANIETAHAAAQVHQRHNYAELENQKASRRRSYSYAPADKKD